MSKLNIKQALKPMDAQTLTNPIGTAPGVFWDLSLKTGKPTYILTFPGVPKELYAMWPQGVAHLKEKQAELGEHSQILVTRFLNFFGIGESKLGEILRDLMESNNPTVAPYVGRGEVRIRLAAKASNNDEANKILLPVQTEILRRCGSFYFGEDEASLEQCVGTMLVEQGLTLAVAESCTGGLISSRLTDVPGSSRYIHLNLVAYSNTQKIKHLGISAQTLSDFGAVSPETAREMVEGIQKKTGCSIGLATTGIAGPDGGTEVKPVGLVYIAICDAQKTIVKKIMVNPHYGRQDIKYWFSQYALHFLRLFLSGELEPDPISDVPAPDPKQFLLSETNPPMASSSL